MQQHKQQISGIRLLIGMAAAILVAGIVWFYLVKPVFHDSSDDYIFNGWIYSQEDQKTACTALAKAGLSDYRWEEGKLKVPKRKRQEYQTILADSGAFPKAPSDAKLSSLKEMTQFESESKTRLRELNACALQLERTLGRMEMIEYATVGVRSRREQDGMIPKTITTASVGIVLKNNQTLTPDIISSLTLCTKYQLGIDNNENISIVDLRSGRSWLGMENAASDPVVAQYLWEQERQEKYWREKFQAVFSHIPNLRVSTSVSFYPDTEPQTGSASIQDNPTQAGYETPILNNGFLARIGLSSVQPGINPVHSNTSQISIGLQNMSDPATGPISDSGKIRLASYLADTESTVTSVLPPDSDLSRQKSDFSHDGDLPLPSLPAKKTGTPSKENSVSETLEGKRLFTRPRAVSVSLGIPRSYARYIAGEQSGSGSANSLISPELLKQTEQAIIDEVKQTATTLLQPFIDQNHWSAEQLNRYLCVYIYPDAHQELAVDTETLIAVQKPVSGTILPKYGTNDSIQGSHPSPEKANPSGQTDSRISPEIRKIALSFWRAHQESLIVGTILSGLILLLLFLRSARKTKPATETEKKVLAKKSTSPTDVLIDDELEISASSRNANSSDDLAIQQEIADLIANNPEQAARIIQHWIQTGA